MHRDHALVAGCIEIPAYSEETEMDSADISALARNLFQTHGTRAVAEAARKAVSFEKAGDEVQAKTWRRIEAVVLEMRGPRES